MTTSTTDDNNGAAASRVRDLLRQVQQGQVGVEAAAQALLLRAAERRAGADAQVCVYVYIHMSIYQWCLGMLPLDGLGYTGWLFGGIHSWPSPPLLDRDFGFEVTVFTAAVLTPIN
jgi:hypothetical protein